MPSFDITSEVDAQEIRNAVDQASREVANRFDFKDTGSSLDLGDDGAATNAIRLSRARRRGHRLRAGRAPGPVDRC